MLDFKRLCFVLTMAVTTMGCGLWRTFLHGDGRQSANQPTASPSEEEVSAADTAPPAPAAAEEPARPAEPAGPTCKPDGSQVAGSGECCSSKTRWGKNAEGWICCDGQSDDCR